jgi:hypothetical protein
VREDVALADREEVGFALEAQVLGQRGRPQALGANDALVVEALAGARRDQIRKVEDLVEDGLRLVHAREEARVRGIHEAWLARIGRQHDDAQPVVAECVAKPVPLLDRARAIDAATRAEPGARVRVRAALDAELRRIAHQHDALPAPCGARFAIARARARTRFARARGGGRGGSICVDHGRGIPGGRVLASKPPACSRCDWGVAQ